MVLFKRKPLNPLPNPVIENEDADVLLISETGEIFTSYESYLQRMDFYKQKRFICEITGHSGLSFFDALRSEQAGSKDIDDAFPEALREPVLRKVQFSTISRIDNLVDHVYDEFKDDYYPGEVVTMVTDDQSRLTGTIREKVKFPELKHKDGSTQREAFARYLLSLHDKPGEEALADSRTLVRDRKIFTKMMLRSFIKNTVTREAWSGAPWLVKPQYAQDYHIDMNVPPHLQYGNKVAEKKAMKKQEQEGMFNVWQPNKLPELKPATKGRKSQQSQEQVYTPEHIQYLEYQRAMYGDANIPQHPWAQMSPTADYNGNGYPPQHYPPPYDMSPPNGYPPGHAHGYPPGYAYPPMGPPQLPTPQQLPKPAALPPPVKYPVDDMEVPPLRDGTHRPSLKYLAESQVSGSSAVENIVPGSSDTTVGLLLETWNTLNVYCQVLQLDSFTFDDFLDAMQFSLIESECELFVEIHCAVLKKLVNGENDQNGAIQIALPDLPDPEDEDDEAEEEEESRDPTPSPEPEVPGVRTRSSLNKVQFVDQQSETSKADSAKSKVHRASEMFGDYGWVQRLRKRDFHDGGWQLVMIGLLHQLSGRSRLKEICDQILAHLAPLDAPATIETAESQYSSMDINLRAEALQIICHLFLETKAVKTYLEEMAATMTEYRKTKIEHQRARKEAIANLKALNEERRRLQPEERSPSPLPELEDTMEIEKLEDNGLSIADSDDEEPIPSRTLRRGQDRAAERKRRRDEEEQKRQKAAEEKQNKGSKEYQKVLKAIDKERDRIEQAEESILTLDKDLREADCPRTRCLGKDRFCNRYWWFERNAMPHEGLPESSTADAEYANGRVWVQGPDDMERLGFIDVSEKEEAAYYQRFQMTPAERKDMEEGPTHMSSAKQWGFYETPEDLDILIGWLDTRGNRELKLKKELTFWRDSITKYMEKRAEYLTPREDSEEPPARMSTRTKNHLHGQRHRCLRWRNTFALEELGHKHIDPPPPPKNRRKKAIVEEQQMVTRNAARSESATVVNRHGKPVTRQGSRYVF